MEILTEIGNHIWSLIFLLLSTAMGIFVRSQRKLKEDVDINKEAILNLKGEQSVHRALLVELQKDSDEIKAGIIEINKNIHQMMQQRGRR